MEMRADCCEYGWFLTEASIRLSLLHHTHIHAHSALTLWLPCSVDSLDSRFKVMQCVFCMQFLDLVGVCLYVSVIMIRLRSASLTDSISIAFSSSLPHTPDSHSSMRVHSITRLSLVDESSNLNLDTISCKLKKKNTHNTDFNWKHTRPPQTRLYLACFASML